MKTYLTDLRGQVRGNARLRRRLDASKGRIVKLEAAVARLVTLADKVGLGDLPEVAWAARLIGWRRFNEGEMERLKRSLEGFGR